MIFTANLIISECSIYDFWLLGLVKQQYHP